MIKKTVLICLLAVACASCATTKKQRALSGPGNRFAASTPKPTDDGFSYATAIVITEKTESKGVDAEYQWIKEHYTAYAIKGQSLSMQNDRPYDIITIALQNGKEVVLYFDISNYFGKF